ncbi:hypothetical protein QQF64_000833 [Cirrhinus molitorella]|uniref:BTB domain-containing protein n=1 Tax=Cirrhinus molitorella TaxID=172907 RepID=A0ABR3NYA5_9TELE
MWEYQHPGFALFLLGELQKQQQGSIFCDTLLQTDGVCVPAHSCVLAALSPVLSRVLSTSSAPHSGQTRLLNLEVVGSHVLLKLVRFLYTGEMEIKSQSEHEEVMAAAFRLGLKNLLEKKRVCVDVGRRWREIGVQTDDVILHQESEIVPEPLRIQSSTLPLHSVQPCGLLETNLAALSLFDEDRNINATVPSHSVMTDASISNHHTAKAKKRWKMAKRESQLKKLTRQQINVSGKNFQKLLEKDKRQKSATAEQKEAKLDQLKVKIKLRRSGACWESDLLVSVQGESEKKLEEVKKCGLQSQSAPPNVLPAPSLETLTPPTDLPVSPSNSSPHASTDKCLHIPHHISVSSPLDIPALSSSPPQADESDEHIAKMLDDMLMGLNILPLMPIDRNLDEQDQLGPLQDPKGRQRAAETSAQGARLYVQSCEPEVRKSDVSKTAVPAGSPGQRDKDHSGFQNQSGSNTFELLTHSPGQDNLNKDKNLATVARNLTTSLVEEATAVPAYPSYATGKMPSLGMTSIPDERPDFKLLRCLSPLESDKGDSDVPTQDPSHSQDLESQNIPVWLSESPLKLDFPLSTMIDSSYPHPQPDLIGCQNQSCPDLAENQELNTSFSHNDITSGSSLNIIQQDVKDASEHPNQRKTRSWRLATRNSKVKEGTECQNLENQDQVQTCDDPHCENVNPSASKARRVSTRITNAKRKATAGVKRKSEISSPINQKMPLLNTARKQHEDVLYKPKDTGVVKRGRGRHKDVLLKPKDTGFVKRGRGRPPRSKNTAEAPLCDPKLPTSEQDDCDVEETTDREIEQAKEDVIKETMVLTDDTDDADHATSPTKKDCVSTNDLTVMEGIEMNFCLNPDSTPAEHLRNSEATVSNECSFEASSDVDKKEKGERNEKEEDSARNQEVQIIEETAEKEETEVLRANEFVEENALLALDDGCWESSNGWDVNGEIVVEGEQYCVEMIDGQSPLEEDELSTEHIADDASNKDLRNTDEVISRDASPVQIEVSLQSDYQSEDVATVMSNSQSGEDEDIEVDVVEESVEDPLGILADRQVVILLIEDLMDQDDELDGTEEEEVDVTGEETE